MIKVIRDDAHSVICVPYRHQATAKLAVTIMSLFSFTEQFSLASFAEFWQTVKKQFNSLTTPLDFYMPKLKAEFFIHGSCYAYDDQTRQSLVNIQFANRDKMLLVFGDRHWITTGLLSLISKPNYFSSIPVNLANAFGGANFSANPAGKGYSSQAEALPNIELPSQQIIKSSDTPPLAVFLPLPLSNPDSLKRWGTINQNWHAKPGSCYPEDIDWHFFNRAAEDQQFEQFFRGDEKFILENMHPQKKVLHGALPSLRMRCFFNTAIDEERLHEIPLNLDTVWLLPEQEKGILIWHGQLDLTQWSIKNTCIYTAHEHLNEAPQSIEYYLQKFIQKKPKKTPEPKTSLPSKTGYSPTLESFRHKLDEMMQKIPRHAHENPPKEMTEWTQFIAHLNSAEKMAAAKIFSQTLVHHLQLESLSPSMSDLTQSLAQIAEIKAQIQQNDEPVAKKEEQLATWTKLQNKISTMDKFSQHVKIHAEQEKKSSYRREDVISAYQARISLVAKNLAGLDLSYLDLKGINLSGCNLSQCSFQHTQLNDANLEKTVIINTDFSGASLVKVRLQNASMKACIFHETTLQAANMEAITLSDSYGKNTCFTEALLTHAVFTNNEFTHGQFSELSANFIKLSACRFDFCNWINAKIGFADISQSRFAENNFSAANLEKTVIHDTQFAQCKADKLVAPSLAFKSCRIEKMELTNAIVNRMLIDSSSLVKIQWSKCSLIAATWFNTTYTEATFFYSNLDHVHANSEVRLMHCNFNHCSLQQASFIGSYFANTGFDNCEINGAYLADCHWFDGKINQSLANKIRMIDCELTNCTYKDTNFFLATFQYSNFYNTTFENCNLYYVLLDNNQKKALRFSHCLHDKNNKEEA